MHPFSSSAMNATRAKGSDLYAQPLSAYPMAHARELLLQKKGTNISMASRSSTATFGNGGDARANAAIEVVAPTSQAAGRKSSRLRSRMHNGPNGAGFGIGSKVMIQRSGNSVMGLTKFVGETHLGVGRFIGVEVRLKRWRQLARVPCVCLPCARELLPARNGSACMKATVGRELNAVDGRCLFFFCSWCTPKTLAKCRASSTLEASTAENTLGTHPSPRPWPSKTGPCALPAASACAWIWLGPIYRASGVRPTVRTRRVPCCAVETAC